MATKTISLELGAYERLQRAKREGESFSALVMRAKFGPADARGAAILEVLGEVVVQSGDRAAAKYWEGASKRERTVSDSHWGEEEAR